jgi:Cu/Ag efflux pump CusA
MEIMPSHALKMQLELLEKNISFFFKCVREVFNRIFEVLSKKKSIVLIEFIQEAIRSGVEFKEAILRSGAIRMRPILLTAATTALGAWPITLDPIFSGLAWTLIFGLCASTVFTLVVIPVAYYSIYRKKHGA